MKVYLLYVKYASDSGPTRVLEGIYSSLEAARERRSIIEGQEVESKRKYAIAKTLYKRALEREGLSEYGTRTKQKNNLFFSAMHKSRCSEEEQRIALLGPWAKGAKIEERDVI